MDNKVVIVGASLTKIDRHFDRSLKDLAWEVFNSLMDNVKDDHIDALVVSSTTSGITYNQLNLASIIADHLSLRNISLYDVEVGEAGGAAATHLAYSLIKSGLHKSVLVIGIDKLSDFPTWKMNRVISMLLDSEFEYHYGFSPVNIAALLMKMYMKKYGYKREELAYWPVKMHENASKIPHAQLRFTISVRKVVEGLIFSDPLTIYDTWPLGDGAAALLITRDELASKFSDTKVEIAGLGSSGGLPDIFMREEPLFFLNTYEAFMKALAMAKVEKKKINTLEIHDNYTSSALLILESLKLVEKGSGGRAVMNSKLNCCDHFNINLSGGLKARGHPLGATGLYQIAEIYMQLIGVFPISVNADIGLAHSMSGIDNVSYVTILKG